MRFGNDGPQTCARGKEVACGKPAIWYPALRFFAKGFKLAPPATMLMSLPICEGCSSSTQLEDLVSDETWARFDQLFEANGKALPDRERTQLSWWKIEDAQAGRLP
jgi:hypothetical protein